MSCIRARGLRKAFGSTIALDGVDLTVEAGRIVGLADCEGDLSVLDRDPRTQRGSLMHDVCFIADVAVLPRWMRVGQALDFMAGVHPRFDRVRAEGFLARTTISHAGKVRDLSRGMVTQLHLALIMAVDVKLLVLDEPTLGLDILYRKQFYDSLLNDYFDGDRTILISTHDVAEVEHILTDVVFLDRGRVVLDSSMEDVEARYLEVVVGPDRLAAARALRPLNERTLLGRSILLFDGVARDQLAALGEVRAPGLADVFVALMGGTRMAREAA